MHEPRGRVRPHRIPFMTPPRRTKSGKQVALLFIVAWVIMLVVLFTVLVFLKLGGPPVLPEQPDGEPGVTQPASTSSEDAAD